MVLPDCVSLLTGPWSLANSDERGGGAGFWEPWVYVWLLGCATLKGRHRYSLRFWPEVDAGWDCLWMDVYSGFTLSLIKSHPSRRQPWSLAFLGGCLQRLQQYAGLGHRPFLSAFLFQYSISISKISIKFFWGGRQFPRLLQAHCLWQTEQRVGVCALCLSFAVSSTWLGQQLPNLGFRVSVNWPLTYLVEGLNSFHCFYPWGSGKSVCIWFPTSQPCTHELGICIASDHSSPH